MFTPTVAVRLYRPIALALEASGIPADPVLAEFGMPSPARAGWDVRVPLPQIAGIWDRLLGVTGDRFFPLRAAEHVDLTTCDVITYLEANARTLGEALARKIEYLRLITDAVTWTLVVEGDEAVLTLHEQPPRPPLAPVAEYLIGARHVFLRQFGPTGWRLRFVHFRHPAPAPSDPHQRLFGVEPRFGAAHDEIGFDASFLDQPMRARDDALADLLARYADHAVASLPAGPPGFAGRVGQALAGGVDPGVTAVARRLGVSRRTLQRALAAERTSYAEIARSVRQAAAERLLGRRELAVSEVAHALGFGDVPAFHRAFRRWTGFTPGAFRTRRFGAPVAEPSRGRLGADG